MCITAAEAVDDAAVEALDVATAEVVDDAAAEAVDLQLQNLEMLQLLKLCCYRR